jgi:hypothetical protein
LASVFLVVIVNVRRRQVSQAEILAVLVTVAYVLPYFAGFLYMRHMAPIYGVMALTAAVQLTRWHAPVPGSPILNQVRRLDGSESSATSYSRG